jgi:hypothetical protein
VNTAIWLADPPGEILVTLDNLGWHHQRIQPGYTSIIWSNISNNPYNLIFTTKFNDSSILITIISYDYLNLSLADEHVSVYAFHKTLRGLLSVNWPKPGYIVLPVQQFQIFLKYYFVWLFEFVVGGWTR